MSDVRRLLIEVRLLCQARKKKTVIFQKKTLKNFKVLLFK